MFHLYIYTDIPAWNNRLPVPVQTIWKADFSGNSDIYTRPHIRKTFRVGISQIKPDSGNKMKLLCGYLNRDKGNKQKEY